MSMTELSSNEVEQVFANALHLHQSGRLDEAERLYGQVVAANPRHFDALNLLGLVAMQTKRDEKAAELFSRAIAITDKVADVHNNIGEAHRRLGRNDLALSHFGKAVSLEPTFTQARQNFGLMLFSAGRAEEALAELNKVIEAEPDNQRAKSIVADILRTRGAVENPLATAMRLVQQAPTPEAKALFVQALTQAPELPNQPDLRRLVATAINEAWTRPAILAGPATALVKANTVIANSIAKIAAPGQKQLDLGTMFGPFGLTVLAKDELFCALLENTPICDAELEKLLTIIRFLLLNIAGGQSAFDPEHARLYCAIARQCFINGYVFARQPIEEDMVARAKTALAGALAARATPHPLTVIAVAAYEPLHHVTGAEELLRIPAPPALEALFAQQISEPAAEHELAVNIPEVTEIEDETSLAVQRQYEENPYPIWVKAAAPDAPMALDERMAVLFPGTYRPIGIADPDILIAGCGTGQQSIETAQTYPSARVLAIDLSLKSLAYARRKTREAAIANLEYAQADIVKLGGLGGAFDVVESSGVLHHLENPLAGWQTLLTLLKPGGVMRIGLYSKSARSHVRAARDFVKNGGYQPTPEGIRSCRQFILSSKDASLQWVARSPDFFTTSSCRDLLFHVQEHQFTLLEIKAFLDANGLTLLGFENLSPAIFAGYRAAYPDDVTMTDLRHWNSFEGRHPHMFGGMYQFWIQKAR